MIVRSCCVRRTSCSSNHIDDESEELWHNDASIILCDKYQVVLSRLLYYIVFIWECNCDLTASVIHWAVDNVDSHAQFFPIHVNALYYIYV